MNHFFMYNFHLHILNFIIHTSLYIQQQQSYHLRICFLKLTEPLSQSVNFFPAPQPEIVDIVKLNDAKILQLEKSSEDLKAQNRDLENEVCNNVNT